MTSSARRFFERARAKISTERDLADFFAYHLTVELAEPSAKVSTVRACYESCDMAPPSWLASHFSRGLRKPRRYIKANGGYRLENKRREEIAKLLDATPDVQTSCALDKLEAQIAGGPKRDFLHETIKCFSVRAYRATVVMCWNLAAHHLQEYVLASQLRLAAFNAALGKNTDSRVKIKTVNQLDDFTEMPESKFLLFCREAKIITSSLFKKLEGRLDERNAAAHPSGVKVTPKNAEAYIEDLVENVVKKFPC